MSLAKPLAGGMPIGAVLLKQKVADVMKPGGFSGAWVWVVGRERMGGRVWEGFGQQGAGRAWQLGSDA
jgi:hypothetical protein